MTVSPARRAAFEILQRVEQEHAYAAVLLASLDARIRDADRALCHELVLGVLRNQLWLDRLIQHFSDRNFERIDLPVKLALRMAVYQLRFLSRIPSAAAVNESVNLVRAAALSSAAGFVNAVLRRATREADYDPTVEGKDAADKLSIETSHPGWLIDRWIELWGPENVAQLARANNKPPALSLRFTARSIPDLSSMLKELEASGAELTPSRIVPGGWRAAHVNDVIRSFLLEGLIYIQDEASQLVAHLVHAAEGNRILDACAAPGSKATQIASMMPNVTIIACDLYEHRLRTMRELAQRQGVNLLYVNLDASKALPFRDESFDRVLVDAPCSGTGTLRHNPEIRWRIKPSDISELAEKQRRIVSGAATKVKRGGRLLYSTCSLEPEENELIVKTLLENRPEFSVIPLEGSPEFPASSGAIRTWPQRQDTDGFFIAGFERRR